MSRGYLVNPSPNLNNNSEQVRKGRTEHTKQYLRPTFCILFNGEIPKTVMIK